MMMMMMLKNLLGKMNAQMMLKPSTKLFAHIFLIKMYFFVQPQNDMYLLMEGLHEYKGLLSTLPDALMVHRVNNNLIMLLEIFLNV